MSSTNTHSDHLYYARQGFALFDPSKTQPNWAERGAPFPIGKGDKEARFDRVAAGQRVQNLTARSIPLSNHPVTPSNIAFAWWHSLIWITRTNRQQTKNFASQHLLQQLPTLGNDDKLRTTLSKFLLAYQPTFRHKVKPFNPLDIPLTPPPCEELHNIILHSNTIDSIQKVFRYISIDLNRNHEISAPTRAWGLHQLYLRHSQEVHDLLQSCGIVCLQSWDLEATLQSPLPTLHCDFWKVLHRLQPCDVKTAKEAYEQAVRRASPQIANTLPSENHNTNKRSFAELEQEGRPAGEMTLIQNTFSLENWDLDLELSIDQWDPKDFSDLFTNEDPSEEGENLIQGGNHCTQSDIAFAWWYSWISRDRRTNEHQKTHFALQHLLGEKPIFKNQCTQQLKYLKQFLQGYQQAAFTYKNNLLNPLNVQFQESPLQPLRKICNMKNAYSIQEVFLYIAIGLRSNHGISILTRAWGLHQLYLLYSQDIQDLFQSRGIVFLDSWDLDATLKSPLPTLQLSFWKILGRIQPLNLKTAKKAYDQAIHTIFPQGVITPKSQAYILPSC